MRWSWLVALVLLAGCGSEAAAPAAAPDACPELTVIGARGSGQGVDSAEPRGFGREAGALALAVGEAAEPLEWDTEYVGIDYPAVDVPTARARPDVFLDSVRSGALTGLADAESTVASCPSTRLVVIGSSQGAAVAHGIAALLASDDSLADVRSRVLGVVLLGDPTRRRTDGEVEHVDPGGVSASDGFLADDRLDIDPALAGRVLSVCAFGDTVCASPAGATWADLDISTVHNTGYAAARVGPVVLTWLSQRPDVS